MSKAARSRSGKDRSAVIDRRTKETEIRVELAIDGTGQHDVDLEDRFLRHMVETLCRYANWDLKLRARGDIDHHLIEDVAISLGKAFRTALGESPAVERIADATVPFDEALVSAYVDVVERPYVHAELPGEMWEHFFRSFAFDARITVHVVIHRGKNPHHIVEGAFKALGIALRTAVRLRPAIISNKGAVRFRHGG